MKKIFISVIVCIFSNPLVSQDKINKNEFNINITGFVSNYLSFGSASISNNPYLIGYKRRFKNKHALRLGGAYFFQNTNNQVSTNFSRSYSSISDLNYRIGYENLLKLSNKFSWFYGIDYAASVNSFKSKSDQRFNSFGKIFNPTFISTNDVKSYGGGFVAGLQWNVSKQISFFAEARLYGFYTEETRTTNWENLSDDLKTAFPSQNFSEIKNTNFNSNFQLSLPLDLFVVFKF